MKKSALIVLLTLLSIPLYAADVSNLSYKHIGNSVRIFDCDNAASGELIIPASIEGKPVISIEIATFRGCASLTSITIPNSVTNIGESAFEDCTNLVNITIGDSVVSIEAQAFSGCTSLTNFTIPDSVTSIERFAFYRCLNLSSITIPNSVTSIRDNAFRGCASLTNITLPESLTTIDAGAFSGCTSLKDITIPDSITSISIGVFADCTSLSSITIPDSVTSIGSVVFSGCTSLSSVTIGNGVISIGARAFSGCTSLTGITFRGNAPTIGVDLFDFVPANAKVFIYEGSSGFSPEDGKFAGFSLVVQKKSTPLKIISVVGSGDIIPISSLTITFTSSIGSNYAIERSRDLVNWVTVVIIAGKETSTKFTDNEPINDGGDVFYRIREGQ